jgi:hypothetical protein
VEIFGLILAILFFIAACAIGIFLLLIIMSREDRTWQRAGVVAGWLSGIFFAYGFIYVLVLAGAGIFNKIGAMLQ